MNRTEAQISYRRIRGYWGMWRPLLWQDPSQKRQNQARNRTIRSLGRQHYYRMY